MRRIVIAVVLVLVGSIFALATWTESNADVARTVAPSAATDSDGEAPLTSRSESCAAERSTVAASEPPTASSDSRTAMARSACVTVRAMTALGVPLPGCRLSLRPPGSGPRRNGELTLVEGAAGVYSCSDVLDGGYEVHCRVPFVPDPAQTISVCGASLSIDVVIAPLEGLLGGVIRRPSGEGVSRAVLRVVDDSARSMFCVTDRSGRFRFCRRSDASSSVARVVVSDELGEADVEDGLSVELAWGRLEHVIVVAPRKSVSVKLVDSSGIPIADFDAHLSIETSHGRVVRHGPAESGVAWVAGVPTGLADAFVVPGAGWLPATGKVNVAQDGSGAAVLETRRSAILRGTVRSVAGPLSGVEFVASVEPIQDSPSRRATGLSLRLESLGGAFARRVSRVVEAGRFEFGCDPDSSYRVRVSGSGYSPFETTVSAVDGVFDPVEVSLEPAHRVTARVEPLEAVGWLRAYREQGARAGVRFEGDFALIPQHRVRGAKPPTLHAFVDERGLVEFSDVPAGAWLLWLRCPAVRAELVASPSLGDLQRVDLPAIDLAHLRPGRVVGQLESDDANTRIHRVVAAAPGVQIAASVQPDGKFELMAPGGSYGLRIVATAGEDVVDVRDARLVDVVAGSTTSTSRRVSVDRVSLLLLDESGDPVPGAVLSVDEERGTGSYRTARTDSSGIATLYPCPLGEFGVSIRSATMPHSWASLGRVVGGNTRPVTLRTLR